MKKPEYTAGVTAIYRKYIDNYYADIIAQYKYCYAIGLCAEEAQVLGCKLKMSRYRYPDPEKAFPVLDCKDAAKMLQNELNKIDNKK